MGDVSRRTFLKWVGAGALVSVGGTALGMASSSVVRLEEHTLSLPNWTANGFRVAIVADLHLVGDTALDRAQEAARLAIDQRPDLIALLGDYVESSRSRSIKRLRAFLNEFNPAPCAVVAVMGNHDYWTEQPVRVIREFERNEKVRLLRNESIQVGQVQVAGVEDAIAGRHRPKFIRNLGDENVLALFHEPDFVTELPTNVALHVAGHSHGGQICLPGGKPLHLPRGARHYYRGFYPDAHIPLYVSRGVGTSGPDTRAFCPPEVSVLTLKGVR